jgi:hypothetical protein
LAACAKAEAAATDNAAASSREGCFIELLFFLCLSFLREQTTQQGANQLKLVRCPRSLALPRHFTFYVADPVSSIHEQRGCSCGFRAS